MWLRDLSEVFSLQYVKNTFVANQMQRNALAQTNHEGVEKKLYRDLKVAADIWPRTWHPEEAKPPVKSLSASPRLPKGSSPKAFTEAFLTMSVVS